MRSSTRRTMSAIAVLATSALICVVVSVAGARYDRPLEGFGADTPGGSGGAPYEVTSLGDSGPGTLRDAVSVSNRDVSFLVAGTIEFESTLRISANHITIDGSTAPDPGITITAAHSGVTGALLDIKYANDIIVRHLRVRDAPDTNTGDNLRIWRDSHNIVIDHCSFSGAGDGNVDICYDAHDVTLQWCILANTVKNSLIPEGCYNISLHHNLYTCGDERNPQIDRSTFVDMVNNVIHGWAGNYGTRVRNSGSANIVKNYYVAESWSDLADAIVIDADAGPVHMEGNVIPPECPATGTTGTLLTAPPVTEMDPEDALLAVLAEAGAFPRDAIDEACTSVVAASPVKPTSWGQIKAMYR